MFLDKIDVENIKEELLSEKAIFKYITEYDIYYYYLGAIDIGAIFNSPLRQDDTPSFGIFIGKSDGRLVFNDYLLGGGTCITFVMKMENCSYYEALSIINKRFDLGLMDLNRSKIVSKYTTPAVVTNKQIEQKAPISISISIRNWAEHDKQYWQQYGISSSTLAKFQVYPINRFWMNYQQFNVAKYAYAYRYDKNVYKIYQPFLEVAKGKWFSNIKDKNIYQGSAQLPDKGNTLFITSSLKDVMCLYEAGYSAIAPHTEHQILTDDLFQNYSKNWQLMLVLYDNDKAGMIHANKMVDKYGIRAIFLPDPETKDPSDFVQKYDLKALKKWIQKQI